MHVKRFGIAVGLVVGMMSSVAGSHYANADLMLSDFSDVTALSLVGNAAQNGGELRLSAAAQNQLGGAWLSTPQSLQSGFTSVFEFRISGAGGAVHPLGYRGADGLAFVVQNQGTGALGSLANIGYDGITNSVAVEFDTWANVGGISGMDFADPMVENAISVHTLGSAPNTLHESGSIGATTAIPNLKDGAVHTVRIDYVPGAMSVFIDDLITPALILPLDLTNIGGDNILDGNGRALVGFTAGTGGSYENHDLLNWTFKEVPEPSTVSLLIIAASAIRIRSRRRHDGKGLSV